MFWLESATFRQTVYKGILLICKTYKFKTKIKTIRNLYLS